MKKYAVLILLICVAVTVHAQLFPPFTPLRVIRTEKFDIIFPRESEPSARLLATFADSVYEELSSLFGIAVPGRIPVTFVPHTDLFNGYYNPVGNHIVIFDTAMDVEWTTFGHNLKGLFIHELIHAITLNTRGPLYSRLHRVFGNWATPALWLAPAFMVEGSAISMESRDGFGRANDPRVRQILRQAIHEDRFHTPFQASGVFDYPGQRFLFYEYGGLFSTWLQQQYGMEKYASLWQGMGVDGPFSFNVYRSGFYGIFRRVYGVHFLDAWHAFRDSLALSGIEEAPEEVLPVPFRFFYENRNSFPAMAAGENELFILNRTRERVHVYDTRTGDVRTFNTSSVASNDIDISADGTFLLISGYRVTAGDLMSQRGRAVVTEHRTDSGRSTGRSITGLFNARYFRDGVIGIATELHNNRVVFKDFDGNSQVLFRGNPRLMFSRPQAVDNDRIVFVAARGGVRYLMLYNYETGELFRVESSAAYEEDWHANLWRYMRGLGVSDGKIFFSHNVDDRMARLASLNLETMQAVLSKRDFSGGVSNPVSVNGTVYYRASFFAGDGILRFPEALDSISGSRLDISFVRVNGEDYGLVARAERQDAVFAPPDTSFLPVFETRPYLAIRYMNPFNFWMPLPLIRQNFGGGVSVDGVGILTVMTDPTDRHLIIAEVFGDVRYRMASGNIMWQNSIAGFPLSLTLSDTIETNLRNDPFRRTRIGLSSAFSHSPGRWFTGLSFGVSYRRDAEYGGDNDAALWNTAYQWERTVSRFAYFTGLSFSTVRQRQHELFGTGLSLAFRGANVIGPTLSESFQPRFEGRFRSSAELRLPLNLVLYGAYDTEGMSIHGVSRLFGGSIFGGSASWEYPHPSGLRLTWLAGGEASLGVFSFEIQRNLSHLYFNRVFGALSLRNVLYDSQGHPHAEGIMIGDLRLAQSLVFRVGLLSTIIPLKYVPFFLEPNIWGAWRFSNTITGNDRHFSFGAGFNLRL